MSLGDRLGLAGLVVALLGIGLPYVFPDRKGIGWTCFGLAGALLLAWGWVEFGTRIGQVYAARSTWSTVVIFFLGGIVSAVAWLVLPRPDSVAPKLAVPVVMSPSQEIVTKAPTSVSASPIEGLSALGWVVKPAKEYIEFEVANRPLPPTRASAQFFRELRKPFHLSFQGIQSLAGLHELSDIAECTGIQISAAELTDLSELRGFVHLKSLGISQTPLSGLRTVDISPLTNLKNLTMLNLYSTKTTSIEPIRSLQHLEVLNLKETLVRDASPIEALISLRSLDLTGTPIVDLTPLSKLESLAELNVGGKQMPGLVALAGLRNLKRLRVIEQLPIDLGPVASLVALEYVWIWGPAQMDVASIARLPRLRELSISGLGYGPPANVINLGALGSLANLTSLTIGYITVEDLRFITSLSKLEELNLNSCPVNSIEPLRRLANLKKVALNVVPVSDISPLLDLPRLTTLSVVRTPARSDVLTELERRGVSVQR